MRIAPLASATLLALGFNAHAQDGNGAAITLYSGDYEALAAGSFGNPQPGLALIREQLRADLQSGDNTITRSNLPGSIDSAAVRLVPTRDGVRVSGQRFDFALADQDELLRRSVGRRISVDQTTGATVSQFEGVLLAAGNGLTLALDSGAVKVLSNYSSFQLAELPDGLYARPTLRWNVASERAGNETFTLDYPTGGLAWRAEYLATVAGNGTDCHMDFDGAASIVNRSGASFPGAALTQVAGEPNVQRQAQPMMRFQRADAMVADAAPMPQASGEYHAYTLPGRIDLPDGSVQRAPLLTPAQDVACARRYETRSPMGYFRPGSPIVDPEFGPTGVQPVQAMLAFVNEKKAGLGVPLPAGRLRVYERSGASGDAFLGEAAINHTAAGRSVDVALGEAFDLQAERTRKEFRLADDRLSLTETIEIVVSNAKPTATTVRVIESLPRWSDWELAESSIKSSKVDAQTVAFEVPVPASGEATLRYVVRYRWPAAVKP